MSHPADLHSLTVITRSDGCNTSHARIPHDNFAPERFTQWSFFAESPLFV
jgi:hypothetical protein